MGKVSGIRPGVEPLAPDAPTPKQLAFLECIARNSGEGSRRRLYESLARKAKREAASEAKNPNVARPKATIAALFVRAAEARGFDGMTRLDASRAITLAKRWRIHLKLPAGDIADYHAVLAEVVAESAKAHREAGD